MPVHLYPLVSGRLILETHNYLPAGKLPLRMCHHTTPFPKKSTTFLLLSLQTQRVGTEKSLPLCALFRPRSRALAVLPLFSFFVDPLLQPPPMIHEMLSRLDCFHFPYPLYRAWQLKECTYIDVEVQAHGRKSRPPLWFIACNNHLSSLVKHLGSRLSRKDLWAFRILVRKFSFEP